MALLAMTLALPAVSRAQDVEVIGSMPEDGIPALKRILEAAMKQSPTMIQSEINVAQAEANVYAGDHSLWPNFGANGNYGTNRSATAGGASSAASGLYYNVGMGQPLFSWGALANQSRIGRIGLLMARRSFDEAYRQLAVGLREQYMSLILKKLSLRNARFALGLAQHRFDVTNQQYSRGEVSRADYGGAWSGADNANLGVAQAEEDFDSSLRAFQTLAGAKSITEADIPNSIPKPIYNPSLAAALLAELQRDHATSTFQAQYLEMQIHQADLGYKIAKVGLLPKLWFNSGYGVSNSVNASSSQISQSQVDTLTYGASVQWNIFDGFATRGAKLSALASKRLSQQQLENYTEATVAQAEHMVRTMKITEHILQNADDGAKYANERFQAQSTELKLGNIPPGNIPLAQQDAYNAESQSMASRAGMYTQWIEFVSLVGRDPALNHLPQSYVRENP
jgi:outer membrane protein TolC